MPTSTNNTWVGTLIFVAVVSYFWSNDSESSSSLLDGSIFNSVHTDTKPLHASHWPFSLMVTAHVLRTVLAAGNSGSWPSQIVKGCFAAYGGLMMKDVLTGNFGLPSLMDNGEALVTLYITIWYFVNHSIPLTDINLWNKLNGVLKKYVTMFPTFMELCSLGFNSGLLIATATSTGTASLSFLNLPALGSTIFMCVALHAADEFFKPTGFTFTVSDVSQNCLRATCVAVWCGTNALESFPILGNYVGSSTEALETMFGGRSSFLMSAILLNEIAGHVWTDNFGKKPHEYVTAALFTATSVSQNSAGAARDGNTERQANGMYDLENDNINMGMTFAFVVAVSVFITNSTGVLSLTADDLTKGTLLTSVTNNDTTLHAAWPFSLMLTLHILNSVQSNGGYWATDVIRCCFTACGGLMMKDLLSGAFTMPCLFANNEALLSLVIVSWYVRNHNIPFTDFNLYDYIYTDIFNKWVPMDKMMNLCSLSFNCSLLIATAMGSESATNFVGLPALGSLMMVCVAYHCAGQFFNPENLQFGNTNWNDAMQRAVVVAFWCGTNAFGSFPFVGEHLVKVTGAVEEMFGGRATFVMTAILLHSIVSPKLPEKQLRHYVMEGLQKVFHVGEYSVVPETDETEDAEIATDVVDDNETKGEEASDATKKFDFQDPTIVMVLTTLVVVLTSIVWNRNLDFSDINFSSLTDGSLLLSVTSNDKLLHSTFWPFSLMLTMHVLNTVSKASRSDNFLNDLINCSFATYGGLMMSDVLNGTYTMPCLFGNNENNLMLMVILWYIANHDIPFTKINAWKQVHDNVQKFVPLDQFMDLCSTAFNCSLLINTAVGAGSATTNFVHMPAVCSIIVLCVLLHCNGQFINGDGISFSFKMTDNMERATWVAFWCATNGLATLPFIGGLLGGVGGIAENIFSSRSNFLMSMIIFEQMFSSLVTKVPRPQKLFAEAMYTFTGVTQQ